MSPDPVNLNAGKVRPSTVWEYNGNSFPIDIGDAEDAGRLDAALKNLAEAEKNARKDGSLSEIIIAYDAMIRGFFDDLFDDGAGDAILGERRSTTNCNDAYESLLDFVDRQREANEQRSAAVSSRYSGNRAQRRANMFGNRR